MICTEAMQVMTHIINISFLATLQYEALRRLQPTQSMLLS